MRPERWNQIEGLFLQAVEMPTQERERFLGEVCQGDETLRQELNSLLACDVPETPLVKGSFLTAASLSADAVSSTVIDMAGRRIGPYRLVRLLGRGGMGSVHLAVRDDAQYEKEVAIKLLKRGMDTDFMLHRFRQERQILASLEHPFIARLIDGGATDDGLPYFVMEYVDGLPITKFCAEQSLDLEERLRLIRLVCEAVQHAHQHLVIHRDLKPGNILITKERIPKLLDFGIAKLMSAERSSEMPTITRADQRMLTPDYASPEQFLGQSISTSSDIYSLGAVLYELLTSQPAHRFSFDSPATLEKTICEEEPEKPSLAVGRSVEEPRLRRRRRRQLSGDLDNIILTALRKEPQRRYPSVSELSEDIRRHMEGLPVTAREDRVTHRLWKFIRRNKLGVAAAVLIVATLTGGIVSTTFQARRAERRFDLARQLAKAVMADIRGPMERLPGSTAVRASMIPTVLRYLDGLARDPSRDPAFDLEIADAYREVAYVEGSPLQGNLGQRAAALDHYQKAIEIYQAVYSRSGISIETKAHAFSGVIGTNIEAGDIEEQTGSTAAAQARLQKVVALTSEAAVRDASAVHPGTWVYLYFRLGSAERRAGAPQRALIHYQKALEVCRSWAETDSSVNARSTLRGAYANLAGAQLRVGDLDGARSNYDAALKSVEQALRQPDATVYEESTLSGAHQNLADVLGNPDDLNLGDRASAISHYRKAVEIDEALVAADRYDVRARDGLADTYRGLGTILMEDQPSEALKLYLQATALSEELSVAEPSNTQYRQNAASGQRGVGEAFYRLGKNQEALQKLALALETIKSLSHREPDDLSLIDDTCRTHRHIGNVLLASRNQKGAEENYRQALAASEELIRRGPSSLYFQRQHADCLEALGKYYLSLATGRPKLKPEARTWFQKSLALWQDWTARKLATPYAARRQKQAAAYVASCDRL